MAKLNEDAVLIKVSELLRDDQPSAVILDAELVSQLEEVIQQLVGDKCMVEIVRA
jgi:hypothetical protein